VASILAIAGLGMALVAPDVAMAGTAKANFAPASRSTDVRTGTIPAKQLFGHVKTPAPLPPQPIGFYSRGCLAGAVAMPINGSAWQVMRLSRNRNWGMPVLVEFLKKLAIDAQAQDGWPGLLIGDMSQPRGGPMLTGHASHQIGLDADIWLTPMPDHVLSRKERETMSARLMVLDRKRINPQRFTPAHARLIRRAAMNPLVQRIFVHPPIKKYLCDWSRRNGDANRAWLAKVRPYYGHNYHFHVRLRCPPGAQYCKNQGDPHPKDGTGCGAELAYWYSDRPWVRPKPKPKFYHGIPLPRPRPKRHKPKPVLTLDKLPPQCRMVLTAR